MSNVSLYLGDCLEILKNIPDDSIDLVLTDPPYGTTECKWDTIVDLDSMWHELKRVTKKTSTILLHSSQPFTSKLISSNYEMFRYVWYWDVGRSANFAQAPYMPLKNIEEICVFSLATIAKNSKNRMRYFPQGLIDIEKVMQGKKANDHRPNRKDQKPYMQTKTNYPKQYISFPKDAKPIHPTQKPVELLEYLILTYSEEGDVVLDFTMGSGSTGVACVNTNRKFIGIELEEKYFNIAKERIGGIDV